MYRWLTLLLLLVTKVFAEPERHFPAGTHEIFIAQTASLRSTLLENIAPLVTASIAEGNYPGAVILAGHKDRIIYRGVFGAKSILPVESDMTFDTIFDLASLTKVMVTTTAIMQLVEQGKLDLNASVSLYWPEFAENNKADITIQSLLIHYSGLPATITQHGNKEQILQHIAKMKPHEPASLHFRYSDVNFIILGFLVEKISGLPLEEYAKTYIFKPMDMRDTFYLPDNRLKKIIAPTEMMDDSLRWGKVHDPIAYEMAGVSGTAGVFSTASDLAKFATMLLHEGAIPGKKEYLLSPLTVKEMLNPHPLENNTIFRALGWDMESPYSTNKGSLFPKGSFGHTGWTGTSLWIDPETKTWLIILTSRTHPQPAKTNKLIKDRALIANIVAASVVD